jgi:hypothetical protein
MALDNTTQMAERAGLNLKFYEYGAGGIKGTLVLTVDFANEVKLSLSGETVWATGGKAHSKQIGFNDPLEGDATISTQIITMPTLALMTGDDPSQTAISTLTFKNDVATAIRYYIIEGETSCQDKVGNVYAENIIIHKAKVKRAFDNTYSGAGDPQSLDIVLEMLGNEDGEVLTLERV